MIQYLPRGYKLEVTPFGIGLSCPPEWGEHKVFEFVWANVLRGQGAFCVRQEGWSTTTCSDVQWFDIAPAVKVAYEYDPYITVIEKMLYLQALKEQKSKVAFLREVV